MRDHTKLKAFHLADELALIIYRETKVFPKEELYGLTSQMRRAAVSVPSNIVEGCAREGEADYLKFLGIALGSLRELAYQASLAARLGYFAGGRNEVVEQKATEASKVLAALIRAIRSKTSGLAGR